MSNPAETYESYMVPPLFAPWASHLLQSAKPQLGERVLDVGCGTGIVARRTVPHVGSNGKVIGLDSNPNMLAVARATAAREGLAVEWREGQSEKLLFPDGSFDLVLCQFALMFFVDKHAALSEMSRVLTNNGRISLSVWQNLNHHPFYQRLHNVIQQRLGMSVLQDIFALGDSNKLCTLLKDAGFQRAEVEPLSMTARFPNPDGFLAGEIDVDTAAIPLMQHLDAHARQVVTTAIREDMEASLRGVTEGDEVVLPFHAYIVRAKRSGK